LHGCFLSERRVIGNVFQNGAGDFQLFVFQQPRNQGQALGIAVVLAAIERAGAWCGFLGQARVARKAEGEFAKRRGFREQLACGSKAKMVTEYSLGCAESRGRCGSPASGKRVADCRRNSRDSYDVTSSPLRVTEFN
jgi:hypothetical protein